MAELLSDPGTWALLALGHGRPVGHVSVYPGRERRPDEHRNWTERPKLPGLAHLWQLFVLPDWWGRGVAQVLRGAAVAEMSVRGLEHARLYTPSLHARARPFYERRGWSPRGELWNDELQLVLTEYRLALDAASHASSTSRSM